MRIYTPEGDIPFRTLTFPDGQQHIEILAQPDFDTVTIEAPIRDAAELFQILLVRDTLQAMGKATNLDIRYLLGARMDRRINTFQPHTLGVVGRLIRSAGFSKIRILDPHSDAACNLLQATAVYPRKALNTVFVQYWGTRTVILAPDAGSTYRVEKMLEGTPFTFTSMQGSKKRNPDTGYLTDFDIPIVPPNLKGADVLILDDICDGGRTFTGMADVLHKLGVNNVDLFVTHGIFSKYLPLKGIRKVWTTDSYRTPINRDSVRFIPVRMQDEV